MNTAYSNIPFEDFDDLPEEFELEETIEKHEELNPLLFDADKKLLPEIKEKLLAISAKFLDLLEKNDIKIKVDDVILTGSNANFNYTNDSDIDLHILTTLEKGDKGLLYQALYDAYRSLFAKKFDISLHGIPVEVYVETADKKSASGGVYSIRKDEWLKEPEITEIPEIDQAAFDALYSTLEHECENLLHTDYGVDITEQDVEDLITKIYTIRQEGLDKDGEFSTENLVFKELRNNGYLDLLKQLRDDVVSHELSLEGLIPDEEVTLTEDFLSNAELEEIRRQLTAATGELPMVRVNGDIIFNNIKEKDVNVIARNLNNTGLVEKIFITPNGKFDFNSINLSKPGMPNRLYMISCKLKQAK